MASSINTLLLAIDVSKLQNFITAGAVAPIVIGLVIFRFAANAMIKAFVIIVALALGGLIYSQRGQISDCVDQAKLAQSLEEIRLSAQSWDTNSNLIFLRQVDLDT